MPHLVNGLGGVEWQYVIIATSLMTLAGGLMAELSGRDGPFPFPPSVFDPHQAIRALGDRGVRLATLGYFGHMWELYAMWAWFAVFYTDLLDGQGFTDPARTAGYATFAVIGVGALGCWVSGQLGDRWGRTRSAGLAMALSGSCALLIGAASSWGPWMVLGVGLVWGFWVVADSAQFSTMVTELADQRYVGTAVTLQLGIGFTLTVVTIWLVPVVRDASSWGWAFAMLALGPLIGLFAMDRLRRSPRATQLAGGIG
ncbi:MAG: MFS transporter [Acidimicrobiales bacterium]